MILGADVGGVVVPSAIIAFNGVVIALVLLARRRRGAGVDEATGEPAGGTAEVEAWQREHGHALDDWMRDRESLIASAQAGARPAGEPDPGLLNDADAAIAVCPDAELRQSLMAMRDGGEAAIAAFARDRGADGEEAYGAFQRHRDACADRLRQLQVV